jgi:hypothetical protein
MNTGNRTSKGSEGYERVLQDVKFRIMERYYAELQNIKRQRYQEKIEIFKKTYNELNQQKQKQKELESRLADYEQELYEKDRQIDLLQTEKLAEKVDLKPISKNCSGVV